MANTIVPAGMHVYSMHCTEPNKSENHVSLIKLKLPLYS